MRNAATIANAATDAGFIRSIDREAARRQLNMSFGLVVVLSLATLASFLTLGIHTVPANGQSARLTVQAPQIVHTQHADTSAVRQPGG